MKKAIPLILNILSLMYIVYGIKFLYTLFLLLYQWVFHSETVFELNSIYSDAFFYRFVNAHHIFFILLAILVILCLLMGFIGVLKRLKWGLQLVRPGLILVLIYQVIFSFYLLNAQEQFLIRNHLNEDSYMVMLITALVILILLNVFTLVFFFLPIVRNLFEKQTPISPEPTPSLPPTLSAD